MLKNKWWVKKNLLFSGLDPGDELGRVADHLGDDYTPMLFMTGDGHREPPFGWTTKGVWPEFFRELARMNNICCHVEKYSNAVTQDDVPISLRSVYNNGKVFGWEPDFYKELLPLSTEASELEVFYLKGTELKVDPVPMSKLGDYGKYLGKFAGTRAMELRTEIHDVVGATIQKNIDRYSDHLHLITCGDAHLTCKDPLYLHVKPPLGTFGVVDESQK
jgi:hypothetical protein